jgi:enoyl-CoA hydratase/carnithine racemase
MALSCDFRIILKNTFVGLTECKLGIIPGAGGTQRLARLVGVSKAKKIIYNGSFLSSDEAYKQGIVDYVLNDISKNIHTFTDQFLKSAPLSLKAAKKSIKNCNLSISEGLNLETYLYKTIISTYDKQEGLIAFKEKRNPVFCGY